MTNNPTIDGVSPPVNCRQRMAAEGKPYPRSSCEVCGQFSPKWRECDALLDADKVNNRQMGLMQFVEAHPVAPAVERQPAAHRITHNDGYTDGWFNGPPHEGDIEDIKKGALHRVELAYTDSPEVDALQSTIAQLQARVQELESGRVSTLADGIQTLERIGASIATRQQRIDALTAPPAQVAVMVDEQQAFADWTHEVIGMRGLAKVQRRDEMTVEQEKFALKGWLARAGLDATAALNGPVQ